MGCEGTASGPWEFSFKKELKHYIVYASVIVYYFGVTNLLLVKHLDISLEKHKL